MKNQEDNLSPKESLDIITRMILEAKGKVQQNSVYFLLWGWVVMLGNIGMFMLQQLEYSRPYIVWLITIPAWIYTLYRAYRQRKIGSASSHFDKISGALWVCFGIIIFTLIAFGFKINYQLNPLILLFSAVPTFTSGVILRFRPLMMGGILFWLCSIVSFLVTREYQPLVGAAAIAFGYLIPGYLLHYKKD